MQTAVGVDREVTSAPTLCRLEGWANRATVVRLHEVLVEQFIASFEAAPEEPVLVRDRTARTGVDACSKFGDLRTNHHRLGNGAELNRRLAFVLNGFEA